MEIFPLPHLHQRCSQKTTTTPVLLFPRKCFGKCYDLGFWRVQPAMDYDENKVDEMVLALLYLTMFKNRAECRAWKGHNWDAMERLHRKGFISDPQNKAKSVVMSDEGAERAEQLFKKHFSKK
jgi:Domain of unknown function (DUF6429)